MHENAAFCAEKAVFCPEDLVFWPESAGGDLWPVGFLLQNEDFEFFAVFDGTGGIASRAAPEATPRPPSGHLVANR